MKNDLKIYYNNRQKIKELNEIVIQNQLKYNNINALKNLNLNTGYLYDIKMDKDLDDLQLIIKNALIEMNSILLNIKNNTILNFIKKIDNLYLSIDDIENDIPNLIKNIGKKPSINQYNYQNYVLSFRSQKDEQNLNDLFYYLIETGDINEDVFKIIYSIKCKTDTYFEQKISYQTYKDKLLNKSKYISQEYLTPLQVFSILNYYKVINDDYFLKLIQEYLIEFDTELISKLKIGSEMYHIHINNILFILYFNKNENTKDILKQIDENSYLYCLKYLNI